MNADVIEPSGGRVPRLDRRTVDMLHARGLLSAAARDHALDLIEPPRDWGLWAARILTAVGVALVLSGIVYFFAFNWAHIPPLAKLGGLGGLLVVAVGTTAVLGLDHAVGRIATTAATVLVGVFLAVFGQIYQTGADAWGLFALWAALTLPWALLSNSAATWAVWLVVADVGIRLWWAQARPIEDDLFAGSTVTLLLFDGAFLAMREALAARRVAWVSGRWTRYFLLVPVLGAATVAALGWIVDRYDTHTLSRVAGLVAFATIVGSIVVWRVVVRDVAALSLAVMAACVVATTLVFDLMQRSAPHADIGVFFLTGLFTIGIFAAAVAWLRNAARVMEAADHV